MTDETPEQRQERVMREYFSPEANARHYAKQLDEADRTYGGVDLRGVMEVLIAREMYRND